MKQEETQGLELPNNMKPKDYPQKFVQSKEFPKPAPKAKVERLETVE